MSERIDSISRAEIKITQLSVTAYVGQPSFPNKDIPRELAVPRRDPTPLITRSTRATHFIFFFGTNAGRHTQNLEQEILERDPFLL